MKQYSCDRIIIVEGKSDEAFLSSYIDAVYVKTNGYSINKKDLDFINKYCGKKAPLILTDSDAAGVQIRDKINKTIKNGINVVVDIAKCNKNNKHGVAECDINEIINILKEYFVEKELNNTIQTSDLIKLGVIDKDSRNYLCTAMSLGVCNNKTIIKRLNYIKTDVETIKKLMNNYYGNK